MELGFLKNVQKLDLIGVVKIELYAGYPYTTGAQKAAEISQLGTRHQ